MSTPERTTGHVPDGTDLLAQELKDELGHLITHPIQELKRLEHVAVEGDSPTTPFLTMIGTAAVLATIFGLVLALTLVIVVLAR